MRTQTKFAVLLLTTSLLAGCSLVSTKTVVPKLVTPKLASYSDANTNGAAVANSGFLGWVNHRGIITPQKLSEYNALIERFSKNWVPPLQTNDNVDYYGDYFDGTNTWTNTYSISKVGLEKLLWMKDYARQPSRGPA